MTRYREKNVPHPYTFQIFPRLSQGESQMKSETMARFKREHVQSSAITVVYLALIAGYAINLIDQIPLGWGAPIPLMFGLFVVINLWYHSEHRKEVEVEGKWLEAAGIVDSSVIKGIAALSAKYGFKPVIRAYQNKKVGAFTTGWGHGVSIAMTDSLAEKLSRAQQMGVFAHELGHMVNGDILITILTKSASLAMGALQQVVLILWAWHMIFGGSVIVSADQVQLATDFYWNLFFQLLVGKAVINLLAAVISREREQMADAFAVANGFGKGLYEALGILQKEMGISPFLDLALWFFGSHPPLFLRMRDIRMMDTGDDGFIPDWFENLAMFVSGTAAWLIITVWLVSPAPLLFYLAPPFLLALIWEYASSTNSVESLIRGSQDRGSEDQGSIKLTTVFGFIIFLLYAIGGIVVLYLVGVEVFESGIKVIIPAVLWVPHLFLIPLRKHKLAELALLVSVAGFALLTAVAMFSLI
ncbi:M48 family metalloprotease [Candidatus Woesebacteria bacterium]|nr:M48 family metalloprotease [Candidatus Woesebacteria bacterium]